MTQEQFDQLVHQLELYSQQHPKIYKLRVAALAAFGYLFILVAILFLIGAAILIAFLVVWGHFVNKASLLLIVGLLVPATWLLRSLWVQIPAPEGIKLHRKQVPELFALIKRLTKSLQAPQFHQILLTSEFNACVIQIPRLGVLGWQRNYLILGLPLLLTLSPEQFQAVLAHEIGHLSRSHSRFGAWIYQVRKIWLQVFEQFQAQQESQFIGFNFNWFINWYVPFLNAYSFVLARANEYEADRCAAESVGNAHMARALININVMQQYVEKSYWQDVYQQVNHQLNPPSSVFSNLQKFLHKQIATNQHEQLLARSLSVQTDNTDTHPCLSDRLQALGFQLHSLPTDNLVPVTAGEKFLGNTLNHFIQQLDRQWYDQVQASWQEGFNYSQSIQVLLQEIEERAAKTELSLTDAWNRALWTSELKGDCEALSLVKTVIAMEPEHAGANFLIGRMMLKANDPQGIHYLELAMHNDTSLFLSSCEQIYTFLRQNGQTAEAQKYRQKAEEHCLKINLAQQERQAVTCFDALLPHDLPEAEISKLCQQLQHFNVREAYLVRKQLQYFPEQPLYVLAIRCQHSLFTKIRLTDRALRKEIVLIKALIQELQFSYPIYITAFAADGSYNQDKYDQVLAENYLKKVAKQLIYQSSSD